MKRIRLRSALLAGVFVAVFATCWWYFAPTRIGGSTTYVVTHGISMEPGFHTGDLALVRPVGDYKVGDVVAYHSSLLHLVVLHRIVAIRNGHYTFKGDNNNFLDPVRPTRAQLIGRLWVHIPRGGVVLVAVHKPVFDVVALGILGLFLFAGFGETRRRGRRQRKGATAPGRAGPPIMRFQRENDAAQPVNFGALLTASAVALAVFLVLAVVAFAGPAHKPTSRDTSYTQRVTFGYSARVPAGPVYPTGRIKTGDPVFLAIVHQLDVHIAYRFSSATSANIAGTEEVLLKLTGPNGWTRNFVLAHSTRFVGPGAGTDVTLNLQRLQSLMAQIEKLTNNPSFDVIKATVLPVVHLRGTLAGLPVTTSYQPGLSFQVVSGQLQPSQANSGAASPQTPNYAPSKTGNISVPATAPTTITVLGVSPEISLLRWISVIGLLLSAAATLYFFLRKRSEPFEESHRIQSQYGHMIVPIVAGEDLGWPPVDVASIKALVKLAESGQRLILHNRSGDVDTYLLNEEGTVYRYQVRASKVVWGEWTDAPIPADQAGSAAPHDAAPHDAANAA